MIRCTDVCKSYHLGDREVHALRGATLAIPEPGFYAIMGQSGSGKSTLLHLLATLDRPDSGEIYLGGRAVHDLSEREATDFRRKGLGIIFQQFNLIPTMTAAENVELPGLLAGDHPRDLRTRAMKLLDMLDLADRADHRPEAMSGGEQQRVAIARSLFYSPPVLLADEPTGNLDSDNAELLWTLLGTLARDQEMTVLMVTHEPAAAAHCRRVFVLHDGRVCNTIETEDLDAVGVAARYQQALRNA
ncbi:Lipoprotein releasing system ATP-binding protein LolD [hydrothermal vent metagenome]|uniref:Lipoprotein releasing system ATP-binding protein LolD n=1 Tax=hydrothermal vent metagenome TaxID=652676 RepID=A0A3B1DL27_9ZZZZ